MTWSELLSALANLATVLGVPIFLVSYWANQAEERKRAEYGTYDALDEKYVDFQKLAIENAHLDIADTPLPNPGLLSEKDKAVRRTLYQILISTFERAFLMYRETSDRMRQRQWEGWDAYIESYCDRAAFVDAFFNGIEPAWDYSPTFDRDFEEYLRAKFEKRGVLPPRSTEPVVAH